MLRIVNTTQNINEKADAGQNSANQIVRDVKDSFGDTRIAVIQDGQWLTVSAGCASLADRQRSISALPWGNQCAGIWLGTEPLTDAETGVVYPAAPIAARQNAANE